jgi:hypothetical protein
MTMGTISFSLQYLPFVLCCSLLQRNISSRSKGAASSEQKVFVRTVPKRYLTVCAACFSLSLSLSLYILEFCHDNLMDWKNPKQLKFFLWEKSKALKFIFCGGESRISLSIRGFISLCTCPPFVWVEIICSV